MMMGLKKLQKNNTQLRNWKKPQYFELVQSNSVSLIQQLTSKCQQIHQIFLNLTNIASFLVRVNSNHNKYSLGSSYVFAF